MHRAEVPSVIDKSDSLKPGGHPPLRPARHLRESSFSYPPVHQSQCNRVFQSIPIWVQSPRQRTWTRGHGEVATELAVSSSTAVEADGMPRSRRQTMSRRQPSFIVSRASQGASTVCTAGQSHERGYRRAGERQPLRRGQRWMWGATADPVTHLTRIVSFWTWPARIAAPRRSHTLSRIYRPERRDLGETAAVTASVGTSGSIRWCAHEPVAGGQHELLASLMFLSTVVHLLRWLEEVSSVPHVSTRRVSTTVNGHGRAARPLLVALPPSSSP